jgi:hypothetical protein
MTLEVKMTGFGVAIDNGKNRLVIDIKNQECRVFEHYVGDEGKPKLRTTKNMDFSKLLKTLAKKGNPK